MKYIDKNHPLRDICFTDVRLYGHTEVRANLHFITETKETYTRHTQPITFSLCEAQSIGYEMQRVADKLQKKLDRFKQAISQ